MSEEYPVYPSRWVRFQRWLRNVTVAYLAGMGTGGYGMYEQVLVPFVQAVVDRGYCGDRDPVFFWPHMYRCRDSAVAMDLQQRSIEADQEEAAAVQRENKAILADMDRHQPKKVAKTK